MKNVKKETHNKNLNEVIYNLGQVIETEDTIKCLVDNTKLKKHMGKKIFDLNLYSTRDSLNKKVEYTIENMIFNNLRLSTQADVCVKFKNCKFNNEIYLTSVDKVIFQNNQYSDFLPTYFRGNCFLSGRANSVEFIDDNFINTENSGFPVIFSINLYVDDLKLNNSCFDVNFGRNNKSEINIKAKNINIINSSLYSESLFIDSDNINMKDSKIIATKGIIIDNKNNNILKNIITPEIIYNGIDMSNNKEINSDLVNLQKTRIYLVEKLRKLRDNCININLSELKEVENTLNNRSIVKTMKK